MSRFEISQQLIQKSAKSFAFVNPFEEFGYVFVKVRDKPKYFPPQIQGELEAAPLQQATNQNTEADLNLIQPEAVLRCINKANAVSAID